MPAKVVIVHGNVKPDGRTQRRLPSIQGLRRRSCWMQRRFMLPCLDGRLRVVGAAPTPNRTSSTHVNPRQPGRVPALKVMMTPRAKSTVSDVVLMW